MKLRSKTFFSQSTDFISQSADFHFAKYRFHLAKYRFHFAKLCLSNRINVLKSHICMSSFHIYVQIIIYMSGQYIYISRLQYLYPNNNLYAENVNRHISKCCVIFKQFDVDMTRNFSTYIYVWIYENRAKDCRH